MRDARVSYVSAKYPWLEAVHRFAIPEHRPSEMDVARFKLEARNGPGNYIIFYKWSGYSDCVDVNVQPKTVANRYGLITPTATASNSSHYIKIEHCEFSFVASAVTPCRVATASSVQQCLNDCSALRYSSCPNVMAVRAANIAPPTVMAAPENIPFTNRDNTEGTSNIACTGYTVSDRTAAGCVNPSTQCASIMNTIDKIATLDAYICYGLIPAKPPSLQATPAYVIVNDPADPRFYSTCLFRDDDQGFIDISRAPPPKAPYIPQNWNVGAQQCLTCPFQTKVNVALAKTEIATIFNWKEGVTNICENCDDPIA